MPNAEKNISKQEMGRHRPLYWAGVLLIICGMLIIVYMGVLVWWGDPYTSWITAHKQHVISRELNEAQSKTKERLFRQGVVMTNKSLVIKNGRLPLTGVALSYAKEARAYRIGIKNAEPIGRIRIGSIGLNMVFVQGTSSYPLTFGPGHYNMTDFPGMGGTVAIAGHRTTYLHPFRHIDAIPMHSYILLDMPYGRFVYETFAHRIVSYNDWRILNKKPFEELVLSACHPLYSDAQRYVVFARLVKESPAVAPKPTSAASNHATG